MAFGHLNGLFNVDITANNGIAELLVRELCEREEISGVVLREDGFKISYAVDFEGVLLEDDDETEEFGGIQLS